MLSYMFLPENIYNSIPNMVFDEKKHVIDPNKQQHFHILTFSLRFFSLFFC